ncbi:MAG: hypothetical protein LBJ93_04230 [Clostridiales bacterium]|nr:hypothetical protein [Clostridiales bacterium]
MDIIFSVPEGAISLKEMDISLSDIPTVFTAILNKIHEINQNNFILINLNSKNIFLKNGEIFFSRDILVLRREDNINGEQISDLVERFEFTVSPEFLKLSVQENASLEDADNIYQFGILLLEKAFKSSYRDLHEICADMRVNDKQEIKEFMVTHSNFRLLFFSTYPSRDKIDEFKEFYQMRYDISWRFRQLMRLSTKLDRTKRMGFAQVLESLEKINNLVSDRNKLVSRCEFVKAVASGNHGALHMVKKDDALTVFKFSSVRDFSESLANLEREFIALEAREESEKLSIDCSRLRLPTGASTFIYERTFYGTTHLNYNFGIILPYIENSKNLYDSARGLSKVRENIPFGTFWNIVIQILQAICQLQLLRSVHCDFKPENILLIEGKYIGVVDFGTLHKIGKKVNAHWTIDYDSPEILESVSKNEKIVTARPSTEIYRVGIMLIEIIYNFSICDFDKIVRNIFREQNIAISNNSPRYKIRYFKDFAKIFIKHLTNNLKLHEDTLNWIDSSFNDKHKSSEVLRRLNSMIVKMLSPKQENRPTAQQLSIYLLNLAELFEMTNTINTDVIEWVLSLRSITPEFIFDDRAKDCLDVRLAKLFVPADRHSIFETKLTLAQSIDFIIESLGIIKNIWEDGSSIFINSNTIKIRDKRVHLDAVTRSNDVSFNRSYYKHFHIYCPPEILVLKKREQLDVKCSIMIYQLGIVLLEKLYQTSWRDICFEVYSKCDGHLKFVGTKEFLKEHVSRKEFILIVLASLKKLKNNISQEFCMYRSDILVKLRKLILNMMYFNAESRLNFEECFAELIQIKELISAVREDPIDIKGLESRPLTESGTELLALEIYQKTRVDHPHLAFPIKLIRPNPKSYEFVIYPPRIPSMSKLYDFVYNAYQRKEYYTFLSSNVFFRYFTIVFKKIFRAISDLEGLGYIHLGINNDCVLVDMDSNSIPFESIDVKIIDFDEIAQIDHYVLLEDRTWRCNFAHLKIDDEMYRKKVFYLSPEQFLLRDKGNFISFKATQKISVYRIGIMLLELLHNIKYEQLISKMIDSFEYIYFRSFKKPNFNVYFTVAVSHVLTKLSVNPIIRQIFADDFEPLWFRVNQFIIKTLNFDPDLRPTLEECEQELFAIENEFLKDLPPVQRKLAEFKSVNREKELEELIKEAKILAEQARLAEQSRLAEEARKAEERQRAEVVAREEEARKAEETPLRRKLVKFVGINRESKVVSPDVSSEEVLPEDESAELVPDTEPVASDKIDNLLNDCTILFRQQNNLYLQLDLHRERLQVLSYDALENLQDQIEEVNDNIALIFNEAERLGAIREFDYQFEASVDEYRLLLETEYKHIRVEAEELGLVVVKPEDASVRLAEEARKAEDTRLAEEARKLEDVKKRQKSTATNFSVLTTLVVTLSSVAIIGSVIFIYFSLVKKSIEVAASFKFITPVASIVIILSVVFLLIGLIMRKAIDLRREKNDINYLAIK